MSTTAKPTTTAATKKTSAPITTPAAATKPRDAAAFQPAKRKAEAAPVVEAAAAEPVEMDSKEEVKEATVVAPAAAKKGKFAPAPVTKKAEAVAAEAAAPTAKWSQDTMSVEEFKEIYQSLEIIDGGKTKYFARVDAEGFIVKTIKLSFQNRLAPMGMVFFPVSSKISNDGFCINFALTDEEYDFFENELLPWCRQQIHANPALFYPGADEQSLFEGNDFATNDKLLTKLHKSVVRAGTENKKKPGERYSHSFKSKIRQDGDKDGKKGTGTTYPTVDIYDATVLEDGEPTCLYFHPAQLSKKQLEGEKGKENQAKYRKAITELIKSHPKRVEVCDLVPRFSFIDIEVDLLGISTLNSNWFLSISTKEIVIVKKSESTFVAREIGSKPKSRFAKRGAPAAVPAVGDVESEVDRLHDENGDEQAGEPADEVDPDAMPVDNDGEPADLE